MEAFMEPGVQDDQFPHVLEQLTKSRWEDLLVKEHDGRLLFPDKIYRRGQTGEFDGIPVMIRVLRQHELRQARIAARKRAIDEGLDLDRDKDLISNMEAIHALSMALRDPENPNTPFDPFADKLEENYDFDSLLQVYEKLDRYTLALNPRPETVSEADIVAMAAAISEAQSIAPLAAYGQVAQSTCIVYMAELLTSLQRMKSSSDSSEE
jgi:hypothetical protein